MTIRDAFSPEEREKSRKEAERLGLVHLSTLIVTDTKTQKRSIEIVAGGGPCGIPEETSLPVNAYGSTKTGVYNFNGQEIKGRENVVSAMKRYAEENYSHLLN